MIKKLGILLAVIASLPVIYVFAPLVLPRRLAVSIYFSEAGKVRELARLDRQAARELASLKH